MFSVGVVGMAINWYKSLSEAEKNKSEARKLNSEERLNEFNMLLRELEIEKVRRELALPPSNFVPDATVASESRRFGLNAAVGTHLLNQVLPAYSELVNAHSGITASPASPRAASAGA